MDIQFTKDAWEKMNAYIKIADGEISGLGISSLNESKDAILVRDVRIWKQECTGATTEIIDNAHMIDLVQEYINEGIPMQDINLWWHSHDTMGAFFSSTDKKTISNWFNERYLVAVVGNKKGEFEGTIAIKAPIPCTMDVEKIEMEPQTETVEILTPLELAVQTEIAEKVTEKVYVSTYVAKTKKIKQDNLYLEYQEVIKHMTADQKQMFLYDSALACNCGECRAWTYGNRKKFPFKSHVYDVLKEVWLEKDKIEYGGMNEYTDWVKRNRKLQKMEDLQ